jgi:hypothetical protein
MMPAAVNVAAEIDNATLANTSSTLTNQQDAINLDSTLTHPSG